MKRLRWSSLIFVAGSLMSARSAGAQAPAAPAQQIEARDPRQTISPESALNEARRLSMQGKFDEAIRQLEVLARNQPDLKGVAHELGVAYYKKADYLKAVESFKKALEENPGDNEAVQLMGISYYLAGRPREAIAPLEKVRPGIPAQMSMPRTSSGFATSRRRIIPARARLSRRCLPCRAIRRPVICSPHGC